MLVIPTCALTLRDRYIMLAIKVVFFCHKIAKTVKAYIIVSVSGEAIIF